MSRLLLDEYPLLVMPRLACEIGLNEAIVLQQIHYWTEINRKARKNMRDGFYWTYNTYEEWNKQFPFWAEATIKRTIASLERQHLVVSGVYNQMKMDRTKWYRVDYETVESLEYSPLDQNDPMQRVKVIRPIPETISPENTNNHNGVSSCDENTPPKPLIQDAVAVRAMFNSAYKRHLRKDHPALKPEQAETVIESIRAFMYERGLEANDMSPLIEEYFTVRAMRGRTDYNINHFATHGIMQNLGYNTGVVSGYDV